jgi:WD40 repeat protein
MFVPFTGDPEKAALHEREHGTTQYITKTTSPYIHEHIFQPGGKLFATAPGWQCVELRDSTTGHVVQSFSLPQNHGVTLSFSQDGNRLLAACDSKELVVWDVKAGKKLRTIASNWAHRGAISGDGKRVACADFAHFAEVFDVESGAKLATVLPNLDAECNAIALNHDGTQMATGSKSWKIYLFEIPAMVGRDPNCSLILRL